jgi:outer membrane protein OmpA-like peptidoglycan-associated protein/tetratricopeptide (TPR) repeat protein
MAAAFNFKQIIPLLFFVCVSYVLSAQSDVQRGDQAYELLKYDDAINAYNKYLSDHPSDGKVRQKLVNSLIATSQYQTAESQLEILLKTDRKGDNLLMYADMLILNDKKSEAQTILQEYIKSNPTSDDYKRLFQSAQGIAKTIDENYEVSITKSAFSSEVSDFSACFYGNKIIFTSQKGGKIDPWTGKSFANLYEVSGNQSNATMLSGNLNGKFHNGSCTFVSNETMIFTRNNAKKGDKDDYNLILAFATKKGNNWNFDKEFSFNDRNFSNAYPAYIPTSKMLIFSSDRPGGLGGMDLYYTILNNDKWSDPVNMGSKINTSGNEVFSTYVDNTFYFSSNGHPGIGGLDIFIAELTNEKVNSIKNIGEPYNGSRDDFGYITNDKSMTGYISSNRGGNGDDDNIWYFAKSKKIVAPKVALITGKVIDEFTKTPLKETMITLLDLTDGTSQTFETKEDGRFTFNATTGHEYKLSGIKNDINTSVENISKVTAEATNYFTLLHNDPRFSLEGFALENKSQKGVAGVKVICFNRTKNTETTTITDDKGFFKFQLDQQSDFEVSGTKDGYYTSVSDATTKNLNRSATLYVKLYLSIEEVIIGQTRILGKETFGGFDFDPIYYDLDKSAIRPDAATALDKVVDFMTKNPKLTIELGAHTDSRSSDVYNKDLSERRAVAAVEYIVSKGIANTRITAKGYGESTLVNKCADGVKCAEDMHQQNRRTEIKVLGYE